MYHKPFHLENKMKTLSDIIRHTMALAKENEEIAKHCSGFVRVQPNGENRGSYIEGLDSMAKTWGFLLDAAPMAKEWDHNRMNANFPGSASGKTRYWRVDLADFPEVNAVESLVTVEDMFNDGTLDQLRVSKGLHGYELIYPNAPKAELQKPATTVWIIAGPHGRFEDGVMIEDYGIVMYTWFSGRMVSRMGDLTHCAVKV